jgi:Family of unknown function (DUF6011)
MKPCPRCGKEHDGCRFDAGSLGCVNPACSNPCHRPEWVGVKAADVSAGAQGGEAMTKPVEIEYFAVPDPDDAERMTYWRLGPRGLASWPPNARYGPTLLRRDVPRDLRGDAKREWVHTWFQSTRFMWTARVFEAINVDQHAAAARFAVWQMRCLCCGRALTDPASKTYGIGPECRAGLPVEVLVQLNEEVGRMHALMGNSAPEPFELFTPGAA